MNYKIIDIEEIDRMIEEADYWGSHMKSAALQEIKALTESSPSAMEIWDGARETEEPAQERIIENFIKYESLEQFLKEYQLKNK